MSFSVSVDPGGELTAGFDVGALEGQGDSGDLEIDLTDLILAVGEAAKAHNTGVVILIDEIQFLSKLQLESLIVAIHKVVQRSLPITLVGAGLPQLAELAGEAKSYAERLFKFPVIGQLNRQDAIEALRSPAANLGVSFDDAALEMALDFTEGYPYFLQELGYAVWSIADDSRVTENDLKIALGHVTEKLDSSFFRVRLDRVTELERAYLRAMAQLGPEPQSAAAVAALLGRTSAQSGPTRANLIGKGLLYTPAHSLAAFTVPQFDQFMLRAVSTLQVPPRRPRAPRNH